LLWTVDLAREYGTEVPLWYTGQCPLIDGGTAVIATGGDPLLIGVDCASGEILWELANPGGLKMSHASIIIMTILGKRTYVYTALGGIIGVSADLEDLGSLLWLSRDFNAKVIAPSAVNCGNGLLFVTAGYGAGSIFIQVTEREEGFAVEMVSRNRPNEGFACEQQTPLFYDGHLFGVMPKDGGALLNQFVCYDKSGELVWSSGETNRYGLGPYLLADDKFFILSDEGILTIAEARADKFVPLGAARVLQGRDSWGPIALAGARMIVRDSKQMVCLDISEP
jgi:outer membrane protein assembly factor BamB